jgi:hypothetical protein
MIASWPGLLTRLALSHARALYAENAAASMSFLATVERLNVETLERWHDGRQMEIATKKPGR